MKKSLNSALWLMLTVVMVFAMGPSAARATTLLDHVLGRLRMSKGVTADIHKKVQQEIMGTTTEGNGRFYFAMGKMRLEMTAPQKSLLVYDGKYVWQENSFDDGSGKDRIVVSKVKVGNLKKSNGLMAVLLGNEKWIENFQLKEKIDGQDDMEYHFLPKKGKSLGITDLRIWIDGKNLERIAYEDEQENKVTYDFKKMKLGVISATKFKYRPPKGAEVSEL